ncbi:MAG: rod shape-determining protein RodA [bacterium]
MKEVWHHLHLLRRMNWVMLLIIIALIAVGVCFIYSATSMREDSTVDLYAKQIKWALAGMVCYLGVTLFDYRRLRDVTWLFYVVALVLLVAVLFFGTRIYGAKRWLMFMGVGVQPSEIGKLAVITLSACLLSPAAEKFDRLPPLWRLFLLAAVPMALVMKEPDLGSALVYLPVVVAMVFVAGARVKPLVLLGVSGVVGVLLVLAAVALPEQLGMTPEHQEKFFHAIRLSEYQRDRIEVFLRPGKDPMGSGWNKRQSEIAVGSGGLTGKGYLSGTQNILGFLPRTVAPTDFIFSVITEEMGFLGALGVLTLYGGLVVCGLYAAMVARDKMGRVLCVGVVMMVFTHAFVNMAMTIGVLPVVGIPLPLVSYGGTFMVITLFALGLIQSVYVRRPGL